MKEIRIISKEGFIDRRMDHLLDRYDLNHIYENMDIFKNEEDEMKVCYHDDLDNFRN